jgi:hypothetical protein
MCRRSALVALSALLGCATVAPYPPYVNRSRSATGGDALAAGGVAAYQVASAPPAEATLGWQVEVVGNETSWRACESESRCTMVVRRRPSGEVASIARVGTAVVAAVDSAPSTEVVVFRITFRPQSPLHPVGGAGAPL